MHFSIWKISVISPCLIYSMLLLGLQGIFFLQSAYSIVTYWEFIIALCFSSLWFYYGPLCDWKLIAVIKFGLFHNFMGKHTLIHYGRHCNAYILTLLFIWNNPPISSHIQQWDPLIPLAEVKRKISHRKYCFSYQIKQKIKKFTFKYEHGTPII